MMVMRGLEVAWMMLCSGGTAGGCLTLEGGDGGGNGRVSRAVVVTGKDRRCHLGIAMVVGVKL